MQKGSGPWKDLHLIDSVIKYPKNLRHILDYLIGFVGLSGRNDDKLLCGKVKSFFDLRPQTNLTKPSTLLNDGNINSAIPLPGPVVNSGTLISNNIPAVAPSVTDTGEIVSGSRPINRDSCVSTAIQGVAILSTSIVLNRRSWSGYIIRCGREMWSSIRKGGTLGFSLEGFGIEEIAMQSHSGSKATGVQIRIPLRERW